MTSVSQRQQWKRLIDALDAWTSAYEVSDGKIRVTRPDAGATQQHVDLVMSASDWDELSSTICGTFEDAFHQVKRAVAEVPAHHPFLVHDTYDFHPSMTAELPPDPDEERIRQLMRERPERPVGNWVAVDKGGKVYPFPERPPR